MGGKSIGPLRDARNASRHPNRAWAGALRCQRVSELHGHNAISDPCLVLRSRISSRSLEVEPISAPTACFSILDLTFLIAFSSAFLYTGKHPEAHERRRSNSLESGPAPHHARAAHL